MGGANTIPVSPHQQFPRMQEWYRIETITFPVFGISGLETGETA
jgi:hypothetical protein